VSYQIETITELSLKRVSEALHIAEEVKHLPETLAMYLALITNKKSISRV